LFYTGAQLHRRFIRRFTDALVPPVITVRRHDSLSNPNAPDAAALVLSSGEPARARVPPQPAGPLSRPRARRRPPRLSTAPNSRARHRRHLPRVWPPPRNPAMRRHSSSPATTGGCARLVSSSAAARRHPISLVRTSLFSPLHSTDLGLQCLSLGLVCTDQCIRG
jgi:hypothetical protein